jgi:hypothetical protein
MAVLPHQIGPCQLVELGALVAIRCPSDLDGILRRAGGTWEPASRRWLLSPARAAKVVPKLRRSTDTLFRRAGLNLDHDSGRGVDTHNERLRWSPTAYLGAIGAHGPGIDFNSHLGR